MGPSILSSQRYSYSSSPIHFVVSYAPENQLIDLIKETSTLATGSDLNLFVPDQEGDELWGDIAARV